MIPSDSPTWLATTALAAMLAATAQPGQGQQVAATAAPATVTNSIAMRFVRIPAGSFMMGAVEQDRDAGPHEKPRHRVTISKPFYLAQFELTPAQRQAVMGPMRGARPPILLARPAARSALCAAAAGTPPETAGVRRRGATMNRSTAASASGCGSRWRPSSPRLSARFLETREESP